MFTLVPTYRDEAGNIVSFKAVAHIPGFTHRVIINQRAVDYLGDNAKPSAKVAEFYFRKHYSENNGDRI